MKQRVTKTSACFLILDLKALSISFIFFKFILRFILPTWSDLS